MIEIPRGPCRAFPALARKCVSGRPRGPAPPVVCEAAGGVLTVSAVTGDAGLAYVGPTTVGDGRLVVPMAVLGTIPGRGNGPVTLAVGPGLRGEIRFADRGADVARPFDAVRPGRQHALPTMPTDWHPVPAGFLTALDECGRTAARESSARYALTRVQVRGPAGQVVGSDGRTALIRGKFDLPFAGDLLVPAVPVFGAKEFTGVGEIAVGRTDAHLVVRSGPWLVFLPVDATGRYPDVAGLVPKTGGTVVGIGEADAAVLLDRLPGLPGDDGDDRPVTLTADGGLAVLARDGTTNRVEQIRLPNSTMTGPPVCIAVDRRAVARALELGCRTVRITPGRPIAFEAADRTFIAMALDPAAAVPAGVREANISNDRRTAVRHETNGHAPNGRHDPPADPDPLAAAEEVRSALADALAAAGRLVAVLKHRKKEKKALASVYAGLKALRLGSEGRP